MINLTFVFLRVLMLLVLGWGGYYVQKSGDKKYWKYLLLPIVAFTLNEGLRWGRGIDFNLYYYVYDQIAVWNETSDFEPLFTWFMQAAGYLSLSWQHFVVFMSFFLILSGCVFMRNYKEVMMWALPLFSLQVFLAENLMRWYFGFSFVLIGLYYLIRENKNTRLFWIFSFAGVLCHYGLVVIVPVFYLLSKISRPMLSPRVSVPVMLLSTWLFKSEMMLGLIKYINLFTFSGRFENYQQDLNTWVTKGTAGKETQLDLNTLILYTVLLWGGHVLSRNFGKKYIYVYNLFLIGTLTYCTRIVEIAYRYNMLFSFFGFLIFAYLIQYILVKRYKVEPWLYVGCWVILLNFLRMNLLVFFSEDPNHLLYLWDSGGRETLDLYLWR